MSANKKATVQINRREYERLRQLERSAMFPPVSQNPSYSNAIENTLLNQVDELERRQQDYQQIISGMSNEFHHLETEATEALVHQQRIFIQEVNSVQRGFSLNTDQLLAHQAEVFEQVLHETEENFQEQLIETHEMLDELTNNHIQKRQIAEDSMFELEEIWAWHLQEYKWEQFSPEKFREIEENTDLINRNFDLGNYESCILLLQQSMLNIQRARIQIEKKEAEWKILCENVKQYASRLFKTAKDNRTVFPVDIHGNILTDQPVINVNYWTNGEMKYFMDMIRAIIIQVQENSETLSSKGLKEWLNKRLPALEEELLDIVMIARENVLDSQLRANIADVIIESMRCQGFELTDIEDRNNEIRQPMNMVMKNIIGDEVYINLIPETDEIGRNRITVETAEKVSMDLHELNSRRKQISETLNAYGVEIEGSTDPLPVVKNNQKQKLRGFEEQNGQTLPTKKRLKYRYGQST